jgi:hypothetical protein
MKIFIDTNIYLDFYRLRTVKALLGSLKSVKDKIFLPEQTRNEIIRNRVKAALQRINEDNKKLAIEVVSFPDLLTAHALDETDTLLQGKWVKFKSEGQQLRQKYEMVLAKTIRQVAEGVDPISKELQEIFDNAIPYTQEQLHKARLRKELGNPPGKPNDPLGDQLAWEQLISSVHEEEDVWIVSRDGDYLIGRDDEVTLNPYLYEEFAKCRKGNVFSFQDLASALQHYNKNLDSKLELPPQEELNAARQEQRSATTKSLCDCPNGPSPTEPYPEGRFYMVRCYKCGRVLAVQPNPDID